MSEQPIIFKAQLSPVQSGMMLGPDALQVKLIPQAMDRELAGALYDLLESSFNVTIRDRMGDISFVASFPDTRTAIGLNKKTPQLQILIPKADSLTGLRLYALYGVVFDVEIDDGKGKKKEPKESGPFAVYWQLMGAKRALQSADLWQVLKVDSQKAVKPALYEVFHG
jgi:hypothetical protein